jgi:hypothetical protein
MSFSKIRFDEKKENGELDVSYNGDSKAGLYYTVYLKKQDNKWLISKIQLTGIS